jgi:hypothetical protein
MGRKVVQQTVAHLGEHDAEGRARARALARTITGEREQADFFVSAPVPQAPVPIRLDSGSIACVWSGAAISLDKSIVDKRHSAASKLWKGGRAVRADDERM